MSSKELSNEENPHPDLHIGKKGVSVLARLGREINYPIQVTLNKADISEEWYSGSQARLFGCFEGLLEGRLLVLESDDHVENMDVGGLKVLVMRCEVYASLLLLF
ncbi:hypothetical protein AVEN_222781-1 [Araneus ventricosus]|uniref:Uncharacterized protein n=1 Tax=Araneus ventricosus TaxID=182803 RepID=A0A4Y2B0G1_ARAVE|nr:hypothetical protein AVEN_222781-1 [Araneus ventricosus]